MNLLAAANGSDGTDELETVLAALTARGLKPQRSGDQWAARCPTHDDERASLWVGQGADGRLLLRCLASSGCSFTGIMAALGIAGRKVGETPAAPARAASRIVATYDYVDEAGELLYQVMRTEPKGFRQRKPKPGGGWDYKLGDVRRVIYRLPDVLAAIEQGKPVFVVEGEKDADRLREIGYVATTKAGGAQARWPDDMLELLRKARRVVVIADRDQAGRESALGLADNFATGVVLLEPPAELGPKADVSTMLDAGLGLDALVPLSDAQPDVEGEPEAPVDPFPVETWREFSKKAGDEITYLVEGLWPEGALGFIAAPPKAGKTWLALALSVCLAAGRPYLGRYAVAQSVPVLYIALEGHRAALRARIGTIARGLELNPDRDDDLANLHLAYKPRGINLSDPAWAQLLVERAQALDARLVVVDVLRAGARIRESGEGSQDFAELLGNLSPLLSDGVSVAFLHHMVKVNEGNKDRNPFENMSGSGALFGHLDVGIAVVKSEDGAKRMSIKTEVRDGAQPDPFVVVLEGEGNGPNGGWTYRDALTLRAEDAAQVDAEEGKATALQIAEWIGQRPDMKATPAEIKLAFGIGQGTLTGLRARLSDLGVQYVQKSSRSYYEALPVYPSLPVPDGRTGSLATPAVPVRLPIPPLGGGAGTGRDASDWWTDELQRIGAELGWPEIHYERLGSSMKVWAGEKAWLEWLAISDQRDAEGLFAAIATRGAA